MSKAKDSDFFISDWLRNRNTVEFLGTWELINNPSFVLSASEWIEKTNAIGITVKKGKYGGTYAHKDIAFEFGSAD